MKETRESEITKIEIEPLLPEAETLIANPLKPKKMKNVGKGIGKILKLVLGAGVDVLLPKWLIPAGSFLGDLIDDGKLNQSNQEGKAFKYTRLAITIVFFLFMLLILGLGLVNFEQALRLIEQALPYLF
jgi:hypothetical protein